MEEHQCSICHLPTGNKDVCDMCIESKEDIHLGLTKRKPERYDIFIGYNEEIIIVFNAKSRRAYIGDSRRNDPDDVYKFLALTRKSDKIAKPEAFNMQVSSLKDYIKRAKKRMKDAKL